MDWNHASMCADVSNNVYKDNKDCYEAISAYVSKKSTYKFFGKNGAQGCMFRHDDTHVVFAFRGTQPTQISDLFADLKAWQVDSATEGEVHAGFKKEVDKIWSQIKKQLEGKAVSKDRDTIIVTGHSLGAAMATIAISRIVDMGYNAVLYNFGSPRVGDHKWAKQFDNIPAYRFVNNNDIVTKVPPFGFFTHIGLLMYINYYGNIRTSTRWQRFKDQMRGRWRALQKFQPFDGLFDHSMGLYADKVRKNADEHK